MTIAPLMRHQKEEVERSARLPHWALYWDMGTGKTKVTIETAMALRAAGEIDGLFVLAPKGVHHSWVHDQADHWQGPQAGIDWWSSRAGTKAQRAKEEEVLAADGLAMATMPYSGIMTKAGKEFAQAFLKTRRCLFVLDESHKVKDPGAKRTMRVLAAQKYAPYRRILTGTFLADNPFDAYTQLRFLNMDVWRPLGISDAAVFRSYFGVFERRTLYNSSGKRGAFDQVVGYKNLDILGKIISENGSLVTKDQVLDLPPKTYIRRHFELGPEQRRVYEQVRKEVRVELAHGPLTMHLAIVRLARLQQAACGYLPSDDDRAVRPISSTNPRLEALFEIVEEAGPKKQLIIWAKYHRDIDLILERAREKGIAASRYDGTCEAEDLIKSKSDFVQGRSRLFVATTAMGGEGLNLTCAKLMVFYSLGFKLSERLQAEDRFYRIGQNDQVTIFDLVGIDTVDEHVVNRLRQKREVVNTAMGQEIKAWI